MLSSSVEAGPEELHRAGVREWLSKPVRSSEFFDRLVKVVAPAPVVAAAISEAPTAQSAVPKSLGRVLVVEDNTLNQLVAEGIVSQLGYEVDIADNGAAALDAIAATRYSAVLMDCHMPVMDGYAATKAVREREDVADRVPIIAMTAGAMAEDRERCLAVGMDSYVSKPVDVPALREVLRQWARNEPTVPAESFTGEPGTADDSRYTFDSQRLFLLRRLGPDDGWGLLPAVSEAFLELAPRLVATLREAVARGDSQGCAYAAHELTGAAANIGAVRVASRCQRLEASSAAGAVEGDVVDALESELGRAARELRLLLPGQGPG